MTGSSRLSNSSEWFVGSHPGWDTFPRWDTFTGSVEYTVKRPIISCHRHAAVLLASFRISMLCSVPCTIVLRNATSDLWEALYYSDKWPRSILNTIDVMIVQFFIRRIWPLVIFSSTKISSAKFLILVFPARWRTTRAAGLTRPRSDLITSSLLKQ